MSVSLYTVVITNTAESVDLLQTLDKALAEEVVEVVKKHRLKYPNEYDMTEEATLLYMKLNNEISDYLGRSVSLSSDSIIPHDVVIIETKLKSRSSIGNKPA